MGWNSWDCFGADVREAELLANAKFMRDHLADLGWRYVVSDIAWYGDGLTAIGEQYKQKDPPQLIDSFGRLRPNPVLYPSALKGDGFKPLSDELHQMGLQFGLHLMRGIPIQAVQQNTAIEGTSYRARDIALHVDQCPWYRGFCSIDTEHPGAQHYYDSVARRFSEWGVDFVKADDMSHPSEPLQSRQRMRESEALSIALQKTQHPMILSLSPGGVDNSRTNALRRIGHMWRISADLWDSWEALKRQFDRCRDWAPFATPHSWPDADMLPFGRIGIRAEQGVPRSSNLTLAEQRTLLTLWSMMKSPLFFGGHFPETDQRTIQLISNPEVININQKARFGGEHARKGDQIIWTAQPADDVGLYVGVFNLGDENLQTNLSFADFGFSKALHVRDLWARAELGRFSEGLALQTPPHDVRLVRLREDED